jgi:type VI secretion system (T6SS) baseplate-like injector VgrG
MEDIKDNHLKDANELLRKFFALKQSEVLNSFYPATIVDNNDPDKVGKCKVKIVGMTEGLPDKDLPWAVPDPNFVGSIEGSFIVPPVNAFVRVRFENGDSYSPVYTTKIMNVNNLPQERLEDYPNSIILFKTDPGDYFLINTKTFEMIIRSAGGQTIKFDANGTLDLETMNTLIGNINITSRNLLTIDARFIQSPSGSVVPTGSGFMCAMPVEPLTGLPLQGSFFTRL